MAVESKVFDGAQAKPPSVLDENGEMAKNYDFKSVEEALYAWWLQKGYMKPDMKAQKPAYTIPMPPPNVTGYLHMGHALFVALQDILARFWRMRGHPTLWVPGTDHAGIATQLQVEKALLAEGTSRVEIGRDAFLKRVWEWKEEKGGYILKQMQRLGASADWSRERFTLEPDMSDAVAEAFVRLHEQGLVYRGDYMVNWSPNLQTAISDLEVEYAEEEGRLFYFRYDLADGSGHLPVATTRPETILGDTAVCVHPEDDRYKSFVGKEVKVPMSDRTIPVITDDYVDMDFGTGALKITPGHDTNDYEIGKRHDLPTINILNKDASLNENAGPYAGLDRFEAREKLWQDMEDAGIAIKAEKHMQRVPRSQRGGEVVEPLVSSQWFVRSKGMADQALEAVRTGETVIIPDRFEKTWNNWLENNRDWCVSRQLWWGHRIPVWYVNDQEDVYVVARNEAEALEKARKEHGDDVSLRQEDDVLDTWFSSGLWPFATLGWPKDEASEDSDYAKFYPTAVLETGYDILFFWVARMMMLGKQMTGKAPFKYVYLHGLVRDAQGRKMSKTTGNVIDPLETMDSFGADALRYSLTTGVTPGQDIPLSMEKIEANSNFANKLWNTGRFVKLSALRGVPDEQLASIAVETPMTAAELGELRLAERWAISQCHQMVDGVREALEKYNFGEAGRLVYVSLWDNYADWYIEASKTRLQGGQAERDPKSAQESRRALVYVLDLTLRALHPYMPFITEILWQQLPRAAGQEALMVASWPEVEGGKLPVDNEAIKGFESLQSLVRLVRNARAEYNVELGKKIPATIAVSNPEMQSIVSEEAAVVCSLAKIDPEAFSIETVSSSGEVPAALANEKTVHIVVAEGLEAWLPLSGMVDPKKELARLTKQLTKIQREADGLAKRVDSPGFLSKAPPELVEETRGQLQDKRDQMALIQKSLDELSAS